ncbi:MAG: hypothetical protein RJB01_756 [Actinomycetota bacterium]
MASHSHDRSHHHAAIEALLRERDRLLKRRQLWVAGLVVWAVVVGWVLFGVVNSFTEDADVRITWIITWLLPVAILLIGSGTTWMQLRKVQRELIALD